ncbi:MAG: hypothetical protein NT170_04990 [Candidatus Moranbacteria bacterium]|nr:hypothetical protein [Candidatus Moranbacteria bacterium]
MEIQILVVDAGGELLFQSGNLLFDYLSAYEEYYGGKLEVMRDGQLYDKTSYISEYGTHGAGPAFVGMKKFSQFATVLLLPENFVEGDVIFLDIPAIESFVFNRFLRMQNAKYIALMAALKRMPGGGKIMKLIPVFMEEYKKKYQEFLQNPSIDIIRWRNK